MALHNKVGQEGERLALEYLVSKGYAILETNWRMGHFEIDIVAMHGGRLVFVEVKARTDKDENPVAMVTRPKMRRIATAAHHYVLSTGLPHEVQFDIIAVSGKSDEADLPGAKDAGIMLEHIPDAFMSPLRTY